MKAVFLDDTVLILNNADSESSEVDDGICLIRDKEENLIAELNLSQIKYIRWD